MKYCPYCGASIVGGAASFCAECGRKIPSKPETAEKTPAVQKSLRHRAARPHCKKNMKPGARPQAAGPKKDPMDINYDGYYDDVQPIDAGQQRDRMDPEMVKKVVLLLAGAVMVIALAAALMMLL